MFVIYNILCLLCGFGYWFEMIECYYLVYKIVLWYFKGLFIIVCIKSNKIFIYSFMWLKLLWDCDLFKKIFLFVLK